MMGLIAVWVFWNVCIYTDKLISEIGNQLLYLIDATNKRQNEIRHGRAKQWEGERKKM